jgi:hypothetical protein
VSSDWKRYPWAPVWGDPRWFTFPEVDGHRPELGVSTYFVDGFLAGLHSGRRFAFMFILADMRVLQRTVRATFYTFALFDLDRRHYGTYSDFDFPRPPRVRRRHKVRSASGHADLHYDAPVGTFRWENQRDGGGALRPFAYEVECPGVDHHGVPMHLTLAIDATCPPAPLGGRELGGEMMFLGAARTFSYFQSGLRMEGRLAWGDHSEEVRGTIGWIDRQFALDDFSAHQDRHSSRYRHEWRVMQLDSGWNLSLFHQYHRLKQNTLVPWSGISAQGPAPGWDLRATTRARVDVLEFIRSPGIVRGMSMLTEGPRWFPHRYRVRAPELEMDVVGTPLVDAPAHRLPIEYWTGPVEIAGTFGGSPVTGFGFDERAQPWCRDFEIARALRLSVEHTPGIELGVRRRLAYRLWEAEALALRDDAQAAAGHLRTHVRPDLEALDTRVRERLDPMFDDLMTVLGRGSRRR